MLSYKQNKRRDITSETYIYILNTVALVLDVFMFFSITLDLNSNPFIFCNLILSVLAIGSNMTSNEGFGVV